MSEDDVLYNSVDTSTQLCQSHDDKPWRGPKEIFDVILRAFIHGLSPPDGIVADLTASTGNLHVHLIFIF